VKKKESVVQPYYSTNFCQKENRMIELDLIIYFNDTRFILFIRAGKGEGILSKGILAERGEKKERVYT